MLEESATVLRVIDDRIEVETISRSSCSQCSSSGCSTSVLAKLFGVKRNRLFLNNSMNIQPGHRIVIGIPDEVLVKASMWAYLVPILCLIVATAVAVALGFNDAQQAISGLIGLNSGLIIVNQLSEKKSQRSQFDPVLIRVLEPDNEPILFKSLAIKEANYE